MHCLACDEEIIIEQNWTNFLWPELPKNICTHCEDKFSYISRLRCRICARHGINGVCRDCIEWQKKRNLLTKNESVFRYNEYIQECITKWKYRGDYQLGNIFKQAWCNHFEKTYAKQLKNYIIVPIPLSEEREKERGFNQAEMLAQFLSPHIHLILERNHSEKQSKKSKKERLQNENPFHLKETIKKPVILVDDIYTTGITLRHAANVLKDNGIPVVYSYTLIR